MEERGDSTVADQITEKHDSRNSDVNSNQRIIIKEILEVSKAKLSETPKGFRLGEIVWGRVKGHSAWPAYITKVFPLDHHSKSHARVNFIGHKSQ